MYSLCWTETMFWRQRKINFENIFILSNHIGESFRGFSWGIFIKIPKVTLAGCSLVETVAALLHHPVPAIRTWACCRGRRYKYSQQLKMKILCPGVTLTRLAPAAAATATAARYTTVLLLLHLQLLLHFVLL